MILHCPKCENDQSRAAKYQNKKYGNGKRVHNAKKSDGGSRCTVCGNER